MAEPTTSLLGQIFASSEYIEELTEKLAQKQFRREPHLPKILKALFSTTKKEEVRHYYDNDNDSIFVELAESLVYRGNEEVDVAARDLAVKISKFLICYPDKYVLENEPFQIRNKVFVPYQKIRDIVKKALTDQVGLNGIKWQRNQEEVNRQIARLTQRIEYLINFICDFFESLIEEHMSVEEIKALCVAIDEGDEDKLRSFALKVQNTVRNGSAAIVYQAYTYKSVPDLKGFRFWCLAEESVNNRNRGRVYLRKYQRGSKTVIEIPVATPNHIDCEKEPINKRLSWIANHREQSTNTI